MLHLSCAITEKQGCNTRWPLKCSGTRGLRSLRQRPASTLALPFLPANRVLSPHDGVHGAELAFLAFLEATASSPDSRQGQRFSFPSIVGKSSVEMGTKFWKCGGLLWVTGLLGSRTEPRKSATVSKEKGSAISRKYPAGGKITGRSAQGLPRRGRVGPWFETPHHSEAW